MTGFEHGTHGGQWGTDYQIAQSGTPAKESDGLQIQRSDQPDEMAYGSWWKLKVDRNANTAEFTLNEDQRPTYGPLIIKFYVDGRGNPTIDVDMPWQTAHTPQGESRE